MLKVVCKVPWAGRPVAVDSDQLKISLETNECYATQEIAKIL